MQDDVIIRNYSYDQEGRCIGYEQASGQNELALETRVFITTYHPDGAIKTQVFSGTQNPVQLRMGKMPAIENDGRFLEVDEPPDQPTIVG